ncbi:glycosyltransferase family 4 protein [Agrobacterium sp. ES01]|uniref:glycosyltransferase family 4 protein n=1 Tax=Agrobacterium sp. ES01 TaxID=3420714 RepID=UPI003D14F2F3
MKPNDAARAFGASSDDQRPLVVHVVRQYAPSRGGLEDVVANLCGTLPAQGFRVRVVTLDRLFTDRSTLLPHREIVDDVEVIRIPWRGSSRYPLAPQVLRHIEDADIVHVHAIDFFFDALALAKPFHGKRLVATTHGGFFHTPKFALLKKIWFSTATRLSASAYAALICCSAADKQLFAKISARRSVLIENGVDTRKFADLASNVPQRHLLTIGRFSSNKRLDRLLDTVAALSPEWSLDIIGGPSDWREEDVRHAIAERGLQSRVALFLSAPLEIIKERIAKASLFVSASDYEGFGLVAVEAMSAGLVPVLHTNEAYRQLANTHSQIHLADFSKPAHAAYEIERAYASLVHDPEGLRRQMMEYAEHYAWDHVIHRYADVYQQLLGAASSGKADR